MDMDMDMKKEKLHALQKDLSKELSRIDRTIHDIRTCLAKAQSMEKEEGKFSPTSGTAYSLLGPAILSVIKNEAEYNALVEQITQAQQGRK